MPAMGLKRLSAAVGVYAAHPGPREAVANTVALVIVSNQPFYPLYLHWAVSPVIGPSLLTFLSTPLFAMVPAVMRRSSKLGRSLMLCAGIGNTLLCRFVFGGSSGVEAFLFPCLVLAVLLAAYGATEIAPAGPFYPAEAYHQQYLAKNPNGYCGLGGTGVSCAL